MKNKIEIFDTEYGVEYRVNGFLHREDGPAIIHADGSQFWFQYGEAHRSDGPAVIENGNERWYHFGKLHREDGPAVTDADGHCEWWINDMMHRTGGPAVYGNENGSEYWYQYDEYHRVDGPAIVDPTLQNWWFINGESVNSAKEYQELTGISDDDMTALVLKFGDVQ